MIDVKNLKYRDTIWVLVHDYNHFKPTKAKFIKAEKSDGNPLHDWIDFLFASNNEEQSALACWCFHTKKEAVAYNKQREKEISTEEEAK